MISQEIRNALRHTADFFDNRLKGHVGARGFRKSTPLRALLDALDPLIDNKIIEVGKSSFYDIGCADGRINLFFSYLVKHSIGVEINEWTLDEYALLNEELFKSLNENGLPCPPMNVELFTGDSLDKEIHEEIRSRTGLTFDSIDIFFTFIILYDEFAKLIVKKGKKGAIFIVYGVDLVIPKLPGLVLLKDLSPTINKLAVYQKI